MEIFIFDKKFSTNFDRFRLKTISNEAEIAQKLRNMLILGGYDVIRGHKRGLGQFFDNFVFNSIFFPKFLKTFVEIGSAVQKLVFLRPLW